MDRYFGNYDHGHFAGIQVSIVPFTQFDNDQPFFTNSTFSVTSECALPSLLE